MADLTHYCKGRFCNTEELSVHPHDLGFMRAYGVFDFAPVYRGIPFKLREHLERLAFSAQAIEIEMPQSIETIELLSHELLQKMGPSFNGGLRFFITGGLCETNTLISSKPAGLLILSEKASAPCLDGIKVVTTHVMRPLPHVKTIDYLPAMIGMNKARGSGCQDALYVNAKGELLEGMTSNLFFVKGGKLLTADSEIIKGVTRSVVLEAARDLLPLEMRPLHLSELAACDEAFLTSSTKDLVPILEIDGCKIKAGAAGKITAKLRQRVLALRHHSLTAAHC